ncbi:hypothetical protein J6590_069275 [Homalodisca vitripennis]|nr:hypothetical protein J6590_069275 [Homalodisca vitripennis]
MTPCNRNSCDVAALERKISVRAPRDELVQKGILLLESPTSPLPLPAELINLLPLGIREENRETLFKKKSKEFLVGGGVFYGVAEFADRETGF